MRRFEELCDEAHSSGIEVQNGDISVPDMDAAYINIDCGEFIVLRQDGTMADKACWLAEELGHHVTGTDLVLHYDKVADWKAEARARRWAHMRLLSPDAIRTAARNSTDIYELADALDVSVDFLRESIDDFESKGLWSPISCELFCENV